MDELKNSKLLWVVVGVVVLNVALFFGGRFAIDRIADKVIQKLQKEYSPSPYGPGFDPDKVNPEALKGARRYFEMRRTDPGRSFLDAEPKASSIDGQFPASVRRADSWRQGWEAERDPSQPQ